MISPTRVYLSAVVVVAGAWGCHALVGRQFGEIFAFAPFLIGALLASWFGGLRGALAVLVLGYFIASYFYIHPGTLLVAGQDNLVALAVYVLAGASSGLLAESLHRARREAEAAAERLRVCFQSMGDAVLVTDASGIVVSANPVAASLSGWSEVDAVGKKLEAVFAIYNQVTGVRLESPVSRVLRDGRVMDLGHQTVLRQFDGTSVPIEGSVAAVRDTAGQVQGVVLIFRDVRDKRDAAQILKDSETRLRNVLERMPVCLYSLDEQGQIIVWNRECERITGYSATEVIGNSQAFELLYPEANYREQMFKEWQERRNSYRELEWTITTKEGQRRTLAWSDISLEFPVPGWASWGIAFDVTEQRKAAGHLHRLITKTPVGIYQTDEAGNCVYVNDTWCEIAGINKETALGRGWTSALHPDDRDRVAQQWYRAAESGQEFRSEFRFLHTNGEVRWVDSRAIVMADELGNASGYLGALSDITQRREVERELTLHAHLITNMSDGVSLATEDGRIIYTNPAADRMFGYAAGELLGQHVTVLNAYPAEENERIVRTVREHLETHNVWTGDWRNRKKDGTEFLTSSHIAALNLDGERNFVCVQRDVTEQRRAEEALRESERNAQQQLALLDHVYNTAPVGLGLFDTDLRYVRTNKLLAAIDGLPAAECIGRSLREVIPNLAGQLEPLYRQVMQTGRPIIGREIRGTTPAHPTEEHYWLASYYPVYNPEGKVAGVSAIILDITQQKQAEESLRDADRRKNEFLAMLAHELRNPLATIRYAANLSRLPNVSPDQVDFAEVVERQVQNLARLVDDLLDISRITQGRICLQRTSVDANMLIRRAAEALEPAIQERGHRLTLDLPEEPLTLHADQTRIEQVLQNLLNNAAKYSESDGRIKVTARADAKDAIITVTDDGLGMPKELIPQVFDLFTQGERTLDRSQGGLGIGLTLVRQIIELHSGSVTAYSDGIGHGSSFTIRIPLSQQPRVNSHNGPERPLAEAASKRILVVEDNVDAAQMLELFLKIEGHQVAICHNGIDAFTAAKSFLPNVILLDLGLPGKDGYQIAREIRADDILRDALIIAISGYGQETDRERAREAGFDDHLIKPVDMEVLRAALGPA